jgi:putative component of toxin-antitoxin plasmid stabilization module
VSRRVLGESVAIENGNLGDHKNVGGGVWEARLDFGLLAGGDKASQFKDIAAARRYWEDFRKAKHGKAQ